MFDKKSLYALNKRDHDAIVYTDAFGTTIRLTVEDFSSLKEFRKWKNWMNMKAHSDEKKDHIYRNHTISIYSIPENSYVRQDRESEIVNQINLAEREVMRQLLVQGMQECLSEKQRTYLIMHYVDGLSIREISRQLSLNHKTIYESIVSAKEKIYMFLKK